MRWLLIIFMILPAWPQTPVVKTPKLTESQRIELIEADRAALRAMVKELQTVNAKLQILLTDPEVVSAKAATYAATQAANAKFAELSAICGPGKLLETGLCQMPEKPKK